MAAPKTRRLKTVFLDHPVIKVLIKEIKKSASFTAKFELAFRGFILRSTERA